MDVIKQYPGPAVPDSLEGRQASHQEPAPGQALFPHLTGAEQNASYTGTAVEFTERHTFVRHGKAWGAAHTGPGIRFICDSDAIDDPDHKGFWTPLWLWNRLRHETYKDNRESEIQYLDRMSETADAPAPGDAKPTKKPPEVKTTTSPCGWADRQGAQQLEVPVLAAHREGDHRALHAEARQRLRPLGCTALHLARPIELRCCRFGCAILGLGQPVDLRPRRRPTLRRPARWRRHVAAPARRCSGEHAICCYE